MYVCVNAFYMYSDFQGGQKRVPDPLQLRIKAVMSYLMWVLGTELTSFRIVAGALYH